MRIPDSYDTVFRLRFADPELEKLDVQLRWSYGLVDSAGALVAVDLDAIKAGQAGPEDLARLRALVTDFSGALVSWDVEGDDGEPLGTDVHTVRSLDLMFVLALIGAFMDALREMASRQAEQATAEADLPMEPATLQDAATPAPDYIDHQDGNASEQGQDSDRDGDVPSVPTGSVSR